MTFFSAKSIGVAILAVALSTSMVSGATYKVDPAHSTIGFEVRHMVSTARGEFGQYVASFSFDPATEKLANVVATINTASIDTRNKKRDEHLVSPDFFNTTKYPTLIFKGTKVVKTGKSEYAVHGTLTLLGVTKPVTLKAVHTGNAKSPWGQEVVGFSATAKINRQDFGMKWSKALDNGGVLVGNDITLSLQIEAIKQ